jgi:ATP-dependent RNA helicase DDX3X
MSLDPGATQMQGGPPRRSYIPPHMRGKMDAMNGAPPMNGPGPGPGGPGPAMNGLNQSAWAG